MAEPRGLVRTKLGVGGRAESGYDGTCAPGHVRICINMSVVLRGRSGNLIVITIRSQTANGEKRVRPIDRRERAL